MFFRKSKDFENLEDLCRTLTVQDFEKPLQFVSFPGFLHSDRLSFSLKAAKKMKKRPENHLRTRCAHATVCLKSTYTDPKTKEPAPRGREGRKRKRRDKKPGILKKNNPVFPCSPDITSHPAITASRSPVRKWKRCCQGMIMAIPGKSSPKKTGTLPPDPSPSYIMSVNGRKPSA